ncbi:MAG TPA: hydroxyisourate hydrolase [Gemmatimonadaceae bacterium]|nr:hydroxyisourate hydrolase [Gemmatimonadaceae bacterium]
MSGITTHVLDLSRGVPAAGVEVTLERADSTGAFTRIARTTTDADGRVRSFEGAADPGTGRYRLTFRIDGYFAAQDVESFFPEVQILFDVKNDERSHHVPLLLSPFGYTIYRGS